MFTVRVVAKVHGEGVAAFLAELQDKPQEVPRRFPACRWFGVFVDPGDSLRVLVYEEWDSREAYDECRRSAYTEQVMSVLVPLMDGPPDTSYYQSEPVEPWWQ